MTIIKKRKKMKKMTIMTYILLINIIPSSMDRRKKPIQFLKVSLKGKSISIKVKPLKIINYKNKAAILITT
jgi:hypothetical protein